jgi:RNA polymerase sigma-70 factor, ECF subfamily
MSATFSTLDEGFGAARSGSRDALGALLDSCRPYLLKIARDELPPALTVKGGASDVVQETLLDAIRGFSRFHGDSDVELRAWLRHLLFFRIGKLVRRFRVAGKRQLAREVRLDAADSASLAAVPVAPQSTPSSRAAANERDAALERALARLPADYREVIRLRYQERQSFETIAAAMGRSANAVNLLWFKAVRRLREELGAES